MHLRGPYERGLKLIGIRLVYTSDLRPHFCIAAPFEQSLPKLADISTLDM